MLNKLKKRTKFLILIIASLGQSSLMANTKTESKSVLKVAYFKELMGNVHQNSSRYSQTLTTISCNHPVKILRTVSDDREQIFYGNGEWVQVQVGPFVGFLLKDLLAEKKVECFQDQYPKFFEEMQLGITDLYYLGRLNDQYISGKSKAPEGALIPSQTEGKP